MVRVLYEYTASSEGELTIRKVHCVTESPARAAEAATAAGGAPCWRALAIFVRVYMCIHEKPWEYLHRFLPRQMSS